MDSTLIRHSDGALIVRAITLFPYKEIGNTRVRHCLMKSTSMAFGQPNEVMAKLYCKK